MRDRLHVLQVVEDFLPPEGLRGGVRVSVFNRIRELSRRSRVTVFAPTPTYPPLPRYEEARALAKAAKDWRTENDLPGVRVFRPWYLHLPKLWPLTDPLQILVLGIWLLLRHGHGIDIFHGQRLYPMGFVTVMLGQLWGRPTVITSHGSDLHTDAVEGPGAVRRSCRWALARASRIICVSRALLDVATGLGARRERLRYIPNGVDVEHFVRGDRLPARGRLGLPLDRHLFLCLAYFDPVKGHSVLVDAFRRLLGRQPRAGLLLVGDGPTYENTKERVAAAGIQDNVLFTGAVDHGVVPTWIQAANASVLASWNEGTPLSALESLACGRPLVATDVGGVKEVVNEDRYGLLVPAGDPDALAEAMERSMDHEWDEPLLRERALEYSWPQIAENVGAVYDELYGGTDLGTDLAPAD